MASPRDAVIVAAARTPIGRRGRGLAQVRPDDLAAALVRELLEGTGVAPADVEDVLVGCATPVAEQGWNVGRLIVLLAGFPVEVPAVTINRMCGSSDQAVQFASQAIRSGDREVVLAVGVESMSRVPMASDGNRFSPQMGKRFRLIQQGLSAELVAQKYGFSRGQMDEFSYESHLRAVAAGKAGAFERETLPVIRAGEDGSEVHLCHDEGPRPDTSLEKLAELKPAFKDDGTITAGNSSQMSDGASALLLMSREEAERRGLRPRARVVTSVSVGSDPVLQLTGPIAATARALKKAGLDPGDVDHYEVNEAFACVTMAWMHETGVPHRKVNPRGGAIALGHPLGATGGRLMISMLHALEDGGGRFGLQTMCIGHGMANATIIERLEQTA
ncbi:MAG: thiolase family protein [Candidatus Xenobia bacterium]